MIRGICVPVENAARIHEDRLQQFVREGHTSDAHQLGRYAQHRRRAILVATVLDLETRLTDAILDMADKLIGGLFAKARNAARRRYAASASNVGRLMQMFHGTIEAIAGAHEGKADENRIPSMAHRMKQLRDLPDRKLATIEPATTYKDLDTLTGWRIKADVVREHWGGILRLVASLQAGTVLPSAMLKRLAAFQRQNQLDLAYSFWGVSSVPCSCWTGLSRPTCANAAKLA